MPQKEVGQSWKTSLLVARLREVAAQLEAGQLHQVVLLTKGKTAFLDIDHVCRPFSGERYIVRCPEGAAKVLEHLLNGYQPDIHDLYQPANQRPFTCRSKPLD